MTRALALAMLFFALSPAAAIAETEAERQACMNDAFRVCGSAIPDRHRVFVCMQQNVNQLSPTCRQVILSYSKSPDAMRAFARQN